LQRTVCERNAFQSSGLVGGERGGRPDGDVAQRCGAAPARDTCARVDGEEPAIAARNHEAAGDRDGNAFVVFPQRCGLRRTRSARCCGSGLRRASIAGDQRTAYERRERTPRGRQPGKDGTETMREHAEVVAAVRAAG